MSLLSKILSAIPFCPIGILWLLVLMYDRLVSQTFKTLLSLETLSNILSVL
jgi:hypothetical protein